MPAKSKRIPSAIPKGTDLYSKHGAGLLAGRIAELCGVSAAYIYRILKEAAPPARES
jgi:hypothetical protein